MPIIIDNLEQNKNNSLVDVESFTKFRNTNPKAPSSFSKEDIIKKSVNLYDKINSLQNSLFANPKFAVLILFQGMDASGKDGAIRKIASQLNPQGFDVHSFKSPTEEELRHDFLWRIHQKTPQKGRFTFFNRSHYEDVLISKVHQDISTKTCLERYSHINHFEKLLTDSQTIIIKFFLDISKEEQRERLDERKSTPEKNWKYNNNDEKERMLWHQYTEAYAALFDNCNDKNAPWYCVPADNKWYRDYIVAEIIYKNLKNIIS